MGDATTKLMHYPYLKIYGLIHYIINFSRFKGYEKIHYIEYDVTLNTDIIDKVNEKLDIHDNVNVTKLSPTYTLPLVIAINSVLWPSPLLLTVCERG